MSKSGNTTQLILWRHADAEVGLADSSRQLTSRGRKQAARIAQWLNTRLPADYRLIASPAVRAQQTSRALTAKFLTSPDLAVDASAKGILASIDWPDCGGTTLIVGHQPTLGRLAALLLSGREAPWSIRKSAVWWLWQREHENSVSIRTIVDPDLV